MSEKIDEKACKTSDVHTSTNSGIEEEAMKILRGGNPIDYIMKEYNRIHVGDKELGEFLLTTIGCSLCANTDGLQPDLSGESGKGKSDACKAMGSLVPQEYFNKGSRSAMALFYTDGLKAGSIIFMDDVESFSQKEESILKVATSQYQEAFEHSYTDINQKGANKGRKVSLPPRQSFWITSVSSSFDPQVLNRCIKLHVDESKEQDEAVFTRQKDAARTGSYRASLTHETLVCRAMIKHLKELELVNVSIPFVDNIQWHDYSNRRNFPMFCDIVRAFAAVNQYQRATNEERYLIADLDDFDRAANLWSTIDKAQSTGLTKDEQTVLSAIPRSDNKGISQSQLAIQCNKNKGSIFRALFGIKQPDKSYKGGLMNKVPGIDYNSDERIFRYNGTLLSSETKVSLINRDEIEKCCTRLHTVTTPMQPVLST
ncbi:hypothetical protein [Methanoregula sp.]|uniref:hypothetical protein n=1 Tax=Methanoregula sp. TaxID=2052170 RepID=UPI002370BE0A|nr:hypothetical protein [Methanoregula sp.]MDD1685595.1 hypothetical protein [Methanoregula sp.]